MKEINNRENCIESSWRYQENSTLMDYSQKITQIWDNCSLSVVLCCYCYTLYILSVHEICQPGVVDRKGVSEMKRLDTSVLMFAKIASTHSGLFSVLSHQWTVQWLTGVSTDRSSGQVEMFENPRLSDLQL